MRFWNFTPLLLLNRVVFWDVTRWFLVGYSWLLVRIYFNINTLLFTWVNYLQIMILTTLHCNDLHLTSNKWCNAAPTKFTWRRQFLSSIQVYSVFTLRCQLVTTTVCLHCTALASVWRQITDVILHQRTESCDLQSLWLTFYLQLEFEFILDFPETMTFSDTLRHNCCHNF